MVIAGVMVMVKGREGIIGEIVLKVDIQIVQLVQDLNGV